MDLARLRRPPTSPTPIQSILPVHSPSRAHSAAADEPKIRRAGSSRALPMPCTRRGERLAFLCITALAVATRYFRLTEPAGIVFDETHFGA